MRKKRLLWQIYPSYLLIILMSLLAVSWIAAGFLRQLYLTEIRQHLKSQAGLVEREMREIISAGESAAVNRLCRELSQTVGARITIILPSGKVMGDSQEDPVRMDNHADRSEVMAALDGQAGISSRYSHTLRKEMMYLAIPHIRGNGISAVIRLAIPITSIRQALKGFYLKLALAGLLIALLAAAVSLAVSYQISRPLREMKDGAERFAQGHLDHKLPTPNTEEIGGLAETLNQMAGQLDERIRTILRQRHEQEAVLSSMVEGVLAVDADECILNINAAAADMFGIQTGQVRGRSLQEAVRNTDLQGFVTKTLVSQTVLEDEIILYKYNTEHIMHAHGTTLRDEQGKGIGALIVLNDITRLRRLEGMRRDFVANVSHELKTPITGIQGFVETLLDGAMNKPQENQRFLEIILKYAERLNAIIEDLLNLSRIEEAEKKEIQLESCKIKDVLKSVILLYEARTTRQKYKIKINCPEDLGAQANIPLLEQALINLIDNAVKYSAPDKVITVEAERSGTEVVVRVCDQGCGIEDQHLSRIFERFYRVDKARSRELGGTGLGLAIVKHIAQAHGGSISVESTPGQGSVFAVKLPGLE